MNSSGTGEEAVEATAQAENTTAQVSEEVQPSVSINQDDLDSMVAPVKQVSTSLDQMQIDTTMDKSIKSDQSQRFDRHGNPILTQIGTFSVSNRKALVKSRDLRRSQNSDTGSAESPSKAGDSEPTDDSPYGRKKKHRVTFMDEVSGDKSALTDVHSIESYKKYNQDFYVESPGQGCCIMF